MFYKQTTKIGYISMDKAVISKIILEVVNAFSGKVTVSTKAGKRIGPISKLSGLDEKNHIEINMDGEDVDIRMYIVIRFGTSISVTTERLIEEIKKNIENITELHVKSVAIVVTGMISKHITKRNIEVKR